MAEAKTTAKAKTAKPAAAKPAVKAKKAGVKMLRVTQIASPNNRPYNQRLILIGLGLNKMHRTRELEDTPSIRGAIRKVHHLVRVDEAA